MSKKEIQVFTYGFIVFGIATVILPIIITGTAYNNFGFSIIGGMVGFAGIVYGYMFLRCPHCRISLVFRGLSSNFCPRCGKGFHAE